jgi:hypothetical protein
MQRRRLPHPPPKLRRRQAASATAVKLMMSSSSVAAHFPVPAQGRRPSLRLLGRAGRSWRLGTAGQVAPARFGVHGYPICRVVWQSGNGTGKCQQAGGSSRPARATPKSAVPARFPGPAPAGPVRPGLGARVPTPRMRSGWRRIPRCRRAPSRRTCAPGMGRRWRRCAGCPGQPGERPGPELVKFLADLHQQSPFDDGVSPDDRVLRH